METIGGVTEVVGEKEGEITKLLRTVFPFMFKHEPAKKHRPVHLAGPVGTSAYVDYSN